MCSASRARKTKGSYAVELDASQVVVREVHPGPMSTRHVAAKCAVAVNLGFYTFQLRFSLAIEKTGLY